MALEVPGFLGWKETGKQIQEAVALHPSHAIGKARAFAATERHGARVLTVGCHPLLRVTLGCDSDFACVLQSMEKRDLTQKRLVLIAVIPTPFLLQHLRFPLTLPWQNTSLITGLREKAVMWALPWEVSAGCSCSSYSSTSLTAKEALGSEDGTRRALELI